MNPELQRLLWLTVTPQRLLVIPLILLGGAYALVHILPVALPTLAASAFVVLTMLWGARAAAAAVTDEVRAHTWDLQRLSALGAWSMTWGKLSGATLLPWYAVILCLGMYLSAPGDGLRNAALVQSAALVLLALTAQALGLLGALLGVHRTRHRQAGLHFALVLLALGVLVPLPGLIEPPPLAPLVGNDVIVWAGRSWSATAAAVLLLAAGAAWSLLAAYRAMRVELQIPSLPWAWCGGIVFWGVVGAGFAGAATFGGLSWAAGIASVAIVGQYVAGFALARDPIQYRRLLQALRARRLAAGLRVVPPWMIAAGLALPSAAWLALTGAPGAASLLTCALLALRDMGLLTWASLRAARARPEAMTLVYLLILNHVAPGMARAADLEGVAALLAPAGDADSGAACLLAALHAAIALVLATYAWRHAMRGLSAPGDRRS